MRNFRKAFSLVELIIVIVVIGILATMTTQRLKRDHKNEAMTQLLTMIRYTRSLALHDDKQLRDNPNWQKRFWKFEVANCSVSNTDTHGPIFLIGSDEDMSGDISNDESAVDPSNGKYLYTTCATPPNPSISPNVYLGKKYGIKKLDFKSCKVYKDNENNTSSAQHIGFDKFGRVYKSFDRSIATIPENYGYALTDCRIEVQFQDSNIDSFTIRVSKETGFAYIEEYPNL